MGDTIASGGLSRRDLIKRSAVAGAVVWAAPVLDSSAAWGQTTDCNECDGLTLYSKYAPGNSNTVGNQCLAPCPPVVVISDGSSLACGLYTVDDTVRTQDNRADVTFSNKVRLIRTAIKSTSDCYVATCTDNFCSVRTYGPGLNPPCNTENVTGTPLAGPLVPPLFEFFAANAQNQIIPCGSSPTGTPCGCTQEVRRVKYDTNAVNKPLNFIEILLCLKGTSVLPPGCV